MTMDKGSTNILCPRDQLRLFGYRNYFNSFNKLFKNRKLPNVILLSGLKGIGKATFAYHFINYLLSFDEQDKYSIDEYTISPNNKSYKNLCNHTHPNFFLLECKNQQENIKIDNVRNVLKFLNKTTYNSGIKIVMIDDAEFLNISSSNALLKTLEEPSINTFFFVIHDSSKKITDTIKSRCIQFKFFLNISEKKSILKDIIKNYENFPSIETIDDNFFIDTPGNVLRYLKILSDNKTSFSSNKLSCISTVINEYKKRKDSQLLNFISFLIELFYKELSSNNSKKLNTYFYNKSKIINKIAYMKKFSLDRTNLFISLQSILKNES